MVLVIIFCLCFNWLMFENFSMSNNLLKMVEEVVFFFFISMKVFVFLVLCKLGCCFSLLISGFLGCVVKDVVYYEN